VLTCTVEATDRIDWNWFLIWQNRPALLRRGQIEFCWSILWPLYDV